MLHVNLPVASWRWKNYLDYPDSILLLSIGYQSLSWDVVLVPALQVCIVGVCFIPFRKIEVMWGSLSFVNILVQRCMIYVKNEWMNRMFISRIFLKNTPFFSAWCLAKTKNFFLSWLVPISYHWVVMLSGLEIRKKLYSIPEVRWPICSTQGTWRSGMSEELHALFSYMDHGFLSPGRSGTISPEI